MMGVLFGCRFEQPETASLNLSPFIATAYAKEKKYFKVPTGVIGATLKHAKKRFTGELKENLPAVLGSLAKSIRKADLAYWRKYVFSPTMWVSVTSVAVRRGQLALQQFLQGKTNARYKPAAVMAIIAYLEWEASCGKALDQVSGAKEATDEEKADAAQALINLECNGKGIIGNNNRRELYAKYGVVFKDTLSKRFKEIIDDDLAHENYVLSGGGHGALFHLAQIARYQMAYRAGVGDPIKAIEGFRRVWLYADSKSRRDASQQESQDRAKSANQIIDVYSRWVDIVLGEEGKPERWIELKSFSQLKNKPKKIEYLRGSHIQRWNLRTKAPNKMSLHRQYSLDRAAAYMKHARLAADPDNNGRNKLVDVSPEFLWLFQKFDVKWTPKGGTEQRSISVELGTQSQESTVRGNMARNLANWDNKKRNTSEVQKANMGTVASNTNKHIEEADAAQLLQDLVAIGFSEARDDVVAQ